MFGVSNKSATSSSDTAHRRSSALRRLDSRRKTASRRARATAAMWGMSRVYVIALVVAQVRKEGGPPLALASVTRPLWSDQNVGSALHTLSMSVRRRCVASHHRRCCCVGVWSCVYNTTSTLSC